MLTRARAHTHTHAHAHTCTHTRTRHTHAHALTHSHARAHTHTHTHTTGADGGPKVEFNVPFNWLALSLVGYYLWNLGSGKGGISGPKHEISFQEFRSKLLAKVCV